jgi:hypothetical protein
MTEYSYYELYSDSENVYLRQETVESTTEYITMERSVNDVLECERDAVQEMFDDYTSEPRCLASVSSSVIEVGENPKRG